MRASNGGPPARKNSVNGMIDSHSMNERVIAIAVLSPATGVTMAGVPVATVLP